MVVVERANESELPKRWGTWLAATALSSLLGAAAGCSSILGFEDASELPLTSDSGASVLTDAGPSDASVLGTNVQSETNGPPAARFAPVSVDFGDIECAGDLPDPLALTISNVGGTTLTWAAAISDGDAGPFHVFGEMSGTVAPNAEIAIAISVDPLDDSEVSGQVDTATLLVKTNDPTGKDQEIQVQRTASGGQLVADKTVLQFADGAPDSGVQTQTFTVTNIGDRRILMMGMLTADPSFDVTYPGSPDDVIFDGEDSLLYTVTYDPAHSVGTPNAVTFDTSGPLCGDPPVVVVIPGAITR